MDSSLFSIPFSSDPICWQKILELSSLLRESIRNNSTLKEYFLLWKRISNRISENEYTSAQQQARKKNPNEFDLIELYTYEVIIVFVVRCIAKLKIDEIPVEKFDFAMIIQDNCINLHPKSPLFNNHFLFVDDIFSIWKILSIAKNFDIYTATIQGFLSILLTNLANIPPADIFIILHQRIVPPHLKKLFGEFYTPPELAEIIVQGIKSNLKEKFQVNNNFQMRILDLSCGTGILLYKYSELMDKLGFKIASQCFYGCDINPMATIMAKFVLFFRFWDENKSKIVDFEPNIFCTDALLTFYEAQQLITNKENEILCDSNCKAIQIYFLNDVYEIKLQKEWLVETKNVKKRLQDEIDQAILKKSSNLVLSEKLRSEIVDHPLSFYLKILLKENLCALISFLSPFQIVLGNPPYLRVQSIHPLFKRKIYSDNFLTARGHFDIYYLFIEVGLKLLENEGLLAYITSNKFLHTSSAKIMREYILEQSSIQFMLNFGDSHIFNATILPTIFILKKKKVLIEQFFYIEVQKSMNEPQKKMMKEDFIRYLIELDFERVFESNIKIIDHSIINIQGFLSEHPKKENSSWKFSENSILTLLDKIKSVSDTNLEQISKKISVGIKTTANYAFLEDYSQNFIDQPEIVKERNFIKQKYGRDLFFPIIRGKEIRNFSINSLNHLENNISYIFYPHFRNNNNEIKVIPENHIPVILKYLVKKGYKTKLEQREYIIKANRQWYEIWNQKNPEDMEERIKIVVPDISGKNDFAIDSLQRYVDGSAYFIILANNTIERNRYYVGLLNSTLMNFYHKNISGNTLYAKKYRYWSPYLKQIPLISFDQCSKEIREQIIQIVEILEQKFEMEQFSNLNNLIYDLFHISNEERSKIEFKLGNDQKKSILSKKER